MKELGREYLADMRTRFGKLRETAERAMAQVSDDDFARALDVESNSIAILMKHISGNLRSRCTEFLTSDGEKPGRERDEEFVNRPTDTRTRLMHDWSAAWDLLFGMVDELSPDDLLRTVHVRAEPHTVIQALGRHLSHLAYHVGQIVLLSRHWVGSTWRTLSIARGQSGSFVPDAVARKDGVR